MIDWENFLLYLKSKNFPEHRVCTVNQNHIFRFTFFSLKTNNNFIWNIRKNSIYGYYGCFLSIRWLAFLKNCICQFYVFKGLQLDGVCYVLNPYALHKKFSIKDFFSKCDQIRRSHLLKKCLMENFFFCAVMMFQVKT